MQLSCARTMRNGRRIAPAAVRFSARCRCSVGSDGATAAGLQRSDALEFGLRRGAGFGQARAVDGGTAQRVARGALIGAGLLEAGVDAGFERGAAFGGGHVDIAVTDPHDDGISGSGRSEGGEGQKRKSETHGDILRIDERVSEIDAADRHSVAV